MYEKHRDQAPGSVRMPTRDEIEFHLARARTMRTEATAAALTAAGHGIAAAARPWARRIARWQQQRRTYDALMSRSDRTLADVGIERAHIALIAKGIDPTTHDPESVGVRRLWRDLRAVGRATLEAYRERRRIYRELMTYDDRELEEIGIRRRDIPTIARGGQPAAA